jgi:hypothetical protein
MYEYYSGPLKMKDELTRRGVNTEGNGVPGINIFN